MNMNEDVAPKIDIVWEFYSTTKFGNNVYIGFNRVLKKYVACSDAYPWFHIPPGKQEDVEKQIQFTLTAYEEHLKSIAPKIVE